MGRVPHRFTRSEMDEVAASVLSFLAADPERFDRFLALTGIAVSDLRATAARPGFAGNLLAYLAADEALLVAFAAADGRDPAEVAALAQAAAGPTAD